MSADIKHPAGLDPLKTDPSLDHNEKSAVVRSDGSDFSAPAPDYDDLRDPDVGKSDEERAKLVRLPCLTIPVTLAPVTDD
jgi:hypothetical protein